MHKIIIVCHRNHIEYILQLKVLLISHHDIYFILIQKVFPFQLQY